MKLTISQPALAAVLAKGGSVAPRNHAVPIVRHVRIVASDGLLEVTSTDLDRWAEAETQAEVSEPGAAAVNAADLSALVGRHPKTGVISLELDSRSLIVKCGRSRVKMPTLPPEDFAAFSGPTSAVSFSLPGEVLANALARLKGATDKTGAHASLTGIFVGPGADSLRFVASNRHIVSCISLPLPPGAADAPSFIIPPETIDSVLRVFKGEPEVSISATSTSVSFAAGGVCITSKLIEGQFVPYQAIFEQRSERYLTAGRVDLSACVDRAKLSAEAEGAWSGLVMIPGDGVVGIKGANTYGGEAREEVEADVTAGYEPFGVNPDYIAHFLDALSGDSITIEQVDPKSRHLVYSAEDPNYFGCFAGLKINAAMVA